VKGAEKLPTQQNNNKSSGLLCGPIPGEREREREREMKCEEVAECSDEEYTKCEVQM
jgi:hypothetical protein